MCIQDHNDRLQTDGRLLMASMAGICSEHVSGREGKGWRGYTDGHRRVDVVQRRRPCMPPRSPYPPRSPRPRLPVRPCAGGLAHCSRSVRPAISLMPPMVNTPMLPSRLRPWCQCSPSAGPIAARQPQSLRRRSSRARTRFAGCVHRSAHGWFQPGVASVLRSGRVGRHALFHCHATRGLIRSFRSAPRLPGMWCPLGTDETSVHIPHSLIPRATTCNAPVVSFHECELIRAYPKRRNYFSAWLRAAAAGSSAA